MGRLCDVHATLAYLDRSCGQALATYITRDKVWDVLYLLTLSEDVFVDRRWEAKRATQGVSTAPL